MKKERIIWLDITRTIAIMLVVLCHATEYIYKFNIEEWQTIGVISKLFRTSMLTICRLGVPLFLFITGYLILSKKFENEKDIFKFYKNNLLPLVICTCFWNIIYSIFFNIDYKQMLREIFFISKSKDMMNMWYMPMIIGIYVVLPYISIVVKKINLKAVIIPMIISFLVFFIIPNINLLIDKNIKFVFNTSFYGGSYGLYILVGYYIGNGYLKKANSIFLVIITIFSFVISIAFQFFLYNKGVEYNIWYDFTGIMIMAIAIFELISRINFKLNVKFKKMFTYISEISLAIFFIHIIIQKELSSYVKSIALLDQIKVFILFILSFVASIIIIYVLGKIKILKEKLLLIKN